MGDEETAKSHIANCTTFNRVLFGREIAISTVRLNMVDLCALLPFRSAKI